MFKTLADGGINVDIISTSEQRANNRNHYTCSTACIAWQILKNLVPKQQTPKIGNL
jgi:hypothetical protein